MDSFPAMISPADRAAAAAKAAADNAARARGFADAADLAAHQGGYRRGKKSRRARSRRGRTRRTRR